MSSYTAAPNTEGSIQRIYMDHVLDNKAEVWMVQFKTGEVKILNMVNPYALKFSSDKRAVEIAQAAIKKKIPRTFICTIM